MKRIKQEKGITIVALVVTIVILIILAGISINVTIGDNGIITKAKQAKENMVLAQEEEGKFLNELYKELNSIGEDTGNLEGEAIAKLLEFKKIIATAITNEGVLTEETEEAEAMAENIGKILQERTRDATATASDILFGKTAWVKGKLVTGTNINTSEKLYLYREGDECINITGGWGSPLSKNTNNMTLQSSYSWVYASTNNQINVSDYKYLCADLESTQINHAIVGFTTTKSNISSYDYSVSLYGKQRNIVKVNIEDIQGSLYGLVGASACTGTFYNIWLEK